MLAGALLAIGLAPASAVSAAHPACATTVSVDKKNTAAVARAVAKIEACLNDLDASVAAAARTAQIADERYLRAKAAAAAAAAAADEATAVANAAASTAFHSRARAAVLAVHLARTGVADDAANLILAGGGADRVLYRLSRMSQLTAESKQVFDQARLDQIAANAGAAAAASAASSRARDAAAARAAFATAKQQSDAVAQVVGAQRAQQLRLEADLLGLKGSTAQQSTLANLPANASKAQRAVAFARAQIGDPYVFAGAGPNQWDCSGLTMQAYASVGIDIGGHGATAQYDQAKARGQLTSYANVQVGDLIFYTDGGGDMYHVAIYSGGGRMIEAPYEGLDVREVAVRSYQRLGVVARPTA